MTNRRMIINENIWVELGDAIIVSRVFILIDWLIEEIGNISGRWWGSKREYNNGRVMTVNVEGKDRNLW